MCDMKSEVANFLCWTDQSKQITGMWNDSLLKEHVHSVSLCAGPGIIGDFSGAFVNYWFPAQSYPPFPAKSLLIHFTFLFKEDWKFEEIESFILWKYYHIATKKPCPISWNSRKINNVWAPGWQSKHFHCFPLDSFTFSFPGFVNFMFFNRLDKNHISIEILIELWTLNKIKHKIIWKLPNFQMINL